MFKDSEKIRAAIFDVDGTLLNSTPMWNKLTFAFAEKMGIAAPDALFRTLNSLSLEQCATYYHDVLHVEGTVEEIHEGIITLAREGYAKEVPEITGAAAFLKALSERHIPAAVATASDIASLRP
ncbi:HAD family hydrolase, partial [Hominenteromicrobium sp.]